MAAAQRRQFILGRLITRVAADKGVRSISVVRRTGMEAELKANGADHVLVDGENLPDRVRAIVGEGALTARSMRSLVGPLDGCSTAWLILEP